MEIYIEQVFFDNMVVTYFLLWICSNLLKMQKRKLRFVLASLVGTVFAIIFPLLSLNNALLLTCKVLVGCLIVLTAFKFSNFKQFLSCFVAFLLSTFLLGGAVIGIVIGLFPDFKMQNGTMFYSSKLPVGLFLLIAFVFLKLFYDLVLFVRSKNSLSAMHYNLTVYHNSKAINLKAFLDTGNLLVDSQTNLPIIVVNFSAFKQIFSLNTDDFLMGNYAIKNSRYKQISTANKSSKMLIFEVDKAVINNKNTSKTISNAVLGLSFANFSKNTGCSALIAYDLIKTEGRYDKKI